MVETKQYAFRLPPSLIKRIDAWAKQLQMNTPGLAVTRTDAVRLLLEKSLLPSCPSCGGFNIYRRGPEPGQVGLFGKMICPDCNWWEGREEAEAAKTYRQLKLDVGLVRRGSKKKKRSKKKR